MVYFISGSCLSLTLWLYLTFCHGRTNFVKNFNFWSNEIVFENLFITLNKKNIKEKICVIIPARNEEKTILKTLKSLQNQKINNLEIVVIDDNSTDNTPEIVYKFQKEFKKIFLLSSEKLPKGWVGKTWALKQAVDFANKKKYDYYVFMDSDIVLKKNLLLEVCASINSKNLVMISLMAKLNCKTIWEKILIPPFIFFFKKI